MKIIHLQNLPSKATSENVRDFFEGFHVVDGGVHITTSYDGSVFVSFMSDEDALAAVQLDGRRIFGEPVQLSLCSEQEKEDRLKKLEEEDQILTDCQEIEDHTSSHGERPDRFGPNYREKLRNDIFTKQLKETEAGHLRSALNDNYIQIKNINRHTEVEGLLKFFQGIRPAVRRDSIVLLDAGDGFDRNVAFLRIENRRAFEIALKMDESLVDGYMVQIMECTREDFESASRFEDDFREALRERSREIMRSSPRPRSVSPVHEEEVVRGYDHQGYHVEYHGGAPKHIFEYHLYVKMLPSHVTKGDVGKLFQKCDPGYISVRPDKNNHGWNEALVVLPDEDNLKRAMEKDKIWYEGVQLEVRQYSKRPMRPAGKGKPLKRLMSIEQKRAYQKMKRANYKAKEQEQEAPHYPYLFLANLSDGISPRDIRFLFGVLSRSIPRDGIIIRPDARGDEGYVAFVKFDAQRDFLRAKDMWMNGLYLKGKKIYQSQCTTALIRNYRIDSLWEPKSEGRRYVAEAPRRGLYQQSERPVHLRSRSRSPIRSRQTEHDFGEAWRRNKIRRQQSDFGEAARVVAERELEVTERELAMTRKCEPDFGEASRRNHDEEARQNLIFQSVPSSSTTYYDRFQSRSPPRFRGRSRSLSPVSSLPIDESWSPSMDSSMSRSPQRSLRTRSRSPSRRPHQRSSRNRSRSLSRSYSPIKSGSAPNTYSVPQEQNPVGNTELPPIVSQPAPAAVNTVEKPRFIRVSPMPAWANDIWLTQFFSDCDIKKTSVLIKYNAGKPVHAYLECMTNADVEKACQRNGTYVGTDRICVEPLGDMMV